MLTIAEVHQYTRIANEIMGFAAVRFRTTVDAMRGPNRTQHIATARHFAVYAIRELTPLSFPQIGEIIGRDHSSIVHSYYRAVQQKGFGFKREEVSGMLAELGLFEYGEDGELRPSDFMEGC